MKKKRILVVEDNEDMVELLCQALELLGYEVMVARDGVEAVEMATSGLPDVIVMDIILPRMDGLKAASRIRKNPKTRTIPMLAATAKAMPGDRESCLASGFDDYIAKPFTYRQLGAAVEALLKPSKKQSRPRKKAR